MRLAWFSPLSPNRSGIAAYSTEILPLLRQRYEAIDVFVDQPGVTDQPHVFSAHDFVWKQRRTPYDLTVYQMGNASCHDYMWAYLFNYPGLVVLHDAQLHQARALWLTRGRARRDDYLAEFTANHPEAPPDVGYLVVAGMGESLYQHWPLVRLVLESARLSVVHNRRLRQQLSEQYPAAVIDAIAMGVADPLEGRWSLGGTEVARGDGGHLAGTEVARGGRRSILERHGIPPDAVVLAAFGGVTPEKRIGPLIRALSAVRERRPNLHLMLIGETADHFDVILEARRWSVADLVHLTGFVADSEMAAYLAVADICACLRWPTNRETSASWLRCLAAGRATLVTELTDLVDVPTLDPHDWRPRVGSTGEPIAISIDIVDEDHSLHLAIDRLSGDQQRRTRIGTAARAWWEAHHRLAQMADDYARVIARALSLPVPHPALPAHLRDNSTATLDALTSGLGVQPPTELGRR